MSAPLYFVPDLAGPDPDALARLGLDAVCGDLSPECRGVEAGPGGRPGQVLCCAPAGRAPRVGYFPDAQEWIECAGGAWWFGWGPSAPPAPADLARPSQLVGHPVTLADGADWLVPVARHFAAGSPLPRTLRLAADGTLAPPEVLPRFAEFSARAERIYDAFCAGAGMDTGDTLPQDVPVAETILPLEWCLDTAAAALAFNYRVDRWGLSCLGLLTDHNIMAALRAIIDWPSVEALLAEESKKNPAGERPAAPPSSDTAEES